MKRPRSLDRIRQPSRRPLKIFASDPLLGRTFGNRAKIEIANEPLAPGPIGTRIEVIDFDGSCECYYRAVDLDNPAILMQGGLEPSESDPRFHQQMVYAVATKTLENFDRALGRKIRLTSAKGRGKGSHSRLRLFPHAFNGANAFYHHDLNAILFGYFKSDSSQAASILPGQTVFTCLSHDVIAHEVTHAIVDRLRPLFLEPSNIDVLAFHEGFADVVALLQHFSFRDVLREHIQQTGGEIETSTPLVELARQFGFASGGGKALRSALDVPDAKLLSTTVEPHKRGAILVAAVFDGFFKTYRRRITDLIRIATGGSGKLPKGPLHPDLVNRIAGEANKTAQRVLDMCIRAFDYMPPVDVTFGDFLRAMITADFELVPEDELDCRGAMIEAFRLRGIYPEGVTSLAEESLLWTNVEGKLPALGSTCLPLLQEVFFNAVKSFDTDWDSHSASAEDLPDPPVEESPDGQEKIELDVNKEFAIALHAYATENSEDLGLDSSHNIQVRGFHTVFRVAPDGRLLVELVIQYTQVDRSRVTELGGIPFRGGCTLVASSNGDIRYFISKPIGATPTSLAPESNGPNRLARQREFVGLCDLQNPQTPYLDRRQAETRMLKLMSFSALHGM